MEIETIKKFRDQISRNLNENIFPFWMNHTVDQQNGGFYGRITNDLRIEADAPRGVDPDRSDIMDIFGAV
jgi:mannobiose 2-epimerase